MILFPVSKQPPCGVHMISAWAAVLVSNAMAVNTMDFILSSPWKATDVMRWLHARHWGAIRSHIRLATSFIRKRVVHGIQEEAMRDVQRAAIDHADDLPLAVQPLTPDALRRGDAGLV